MTFSACSAVAAGPYTADDNLDFAPLLTLCERAVATCADALILIGPFLDTEHPLIALGAIDLPSDAGIDPDRATLSDVFRVLIGSALKRVAQALPNVTILLVPSARDAVSRHVSWPQDALARRELGLPRQARCVPNPVVVALNEVTLGVSAQDVLFDLRREEVAVGGAPAEKNVFARLAKHVVGQSHFFPLFPPVNREALPRPGFEGGMATGTPVDVSYLKLAEWPGVRPDVLVLPSSLPPFAKVSRVARRALVYHAARGWMLMCTKVVESVLVANPGSLSKRKATGTFAQMAIYPRKLTDEERAVPEAVVGNMVFDRARVDVVRI